MLREGDSLPRGDARQQAQPTVTLSVISHGQTDLAGQMLSSLAEHAPSFQLEALLACNAPSAGTIPTGGLAFEVSSDELTEMERQA
ncbi:hypothetical protein IMZ48_04755 [Candidatus Bathyarchaeota archaeon]|nr:hypothetical protein [Candidatus Bathyarchaeota archaeon]